MIIYISMFLYIAIVGFGSQQYLENKKAKQPFNNGTNLFFAILILALPVFFIGMRTNFIDTKGYIAGFEALPRGFSYLQSCLEDKGFGFILYEWIIKRFITDNPNMFLMITAIVHAGALLKLYYKYSSNYTFSVLLFFLSMSFTNMMNGIRQFLAVSLIIFFSDYIFEKKTIKFLIVLFIAYKIHVSAIIWLPAFFVVQGKPWNPKIIMAIIAIVAVVFALDSFTDFLSDSLEETDYAGYTDQFAQDDGSSIFHTLIAAVPVVLAFWKRREIEEKNVKHIFIIVNMSVLAVMVSLLANFTSGILIGRFPIFLTLYNFILLPWMFDNVFNEEDRKIMKLACIGGYAMYAVYYMNTIFSKGMPYISDVLGINTWH